MPRIARQGAVCLISRGLARKARIEKFELDSMRVSNRIIPPSEGLSSAAPTGLTPGIIIIIHISIIIIIIIIITVIVICIVTPGPNVASRDGDT